MKTYKQIEAILYKYKYMQTDINLLDVEIEEIQKIDGIGGMNYDDMPKSKNISSTVENELIKKERRIIDLTYKKRKLQLQKEQIDITLDSLEDDLKVIFDETYNKVGRVNIEKLCRRLCISRNKYYDDKDRLVEEFMEIL